MRILRPILWLVFAAVLLGLAGGGVYLWFKVDDWVQPVLYPINQDYVGYSTVPEKVPGLRLTPLECKGWDGGDMTAFIVERAPEGDESSRQLSVMADLATSPAKRLHRIDYVLVCVDWDHGIRSALPLAETLTAAGLRCVLWEPRGAGNRRPYCTHGLKESADVPMIINALVETSGKEKPVIIGVGQGYGAGLMLQAAARDPRLSGLVSVDAFVSLQEAVRHTLPDTPLRPLCIWLMDLKISSIVGFECFDVAPVESAARIDRNVPVLAVNLVRDSLVCSVKDAFTIYRQLKSDKRAVRTLRSAEDAPDATTRVFTFKEGKENKEREVTVEVGLMDDVDSAWTGVIHWLNDDLVDSLENPPVLVPERPVLSPTQHL